MMELICGPNEKHPFWDWNVTWTVGPGQSPDFTPCFESTVLVWVPCDFLWLFSLVEVFLGIRSRARDIPRSPLSVMKYGFTLILILAQFVPLYMTVFESGDSNIYPVDYITPILKIVTYGLFWALLYFSRKKGIRSSGVQFCFWLLHAICESIRFRTTILKWQNQVNPETLNPSEDDDSDKNEKIDSTTFIIEIISFPCILGMLALSCWADIRPKFGQETKLSERPCPEEGSSYLSRMLYEWFTGLAWKGYRKPLEYSDLWDLNTEDKSRTVVPIFDKQWNKQLIKASNRKQKQSTQAAYTKINGAVDFTEKIAEKKQEDAEKNYASILPALWGAFGTTFLVGSLMKLVPDALAFVSPQILNLLIAFTNSDDEVWKGLFYAAILFVSAFISCMITQQYSHRMYLTGMRVRTALVSAIYRKALLVSNSAKRESTVGEIVNLMSVDVQKFMDLLPFINMVWSAPFQIGFAMYFLWGILGPSAIAGLAVMVLLLPANAVIATKSRKLQMQQMKKKDHRVKLMNEILSGIKVLKLYAWESSFEQQIMKIRNEEMEILKKAAFLGAVSTFLWTCAPFLVALTTFGTYVLSDSNNILDSEKAFVSLSLFNIMSFPMTFLPMIIVFLVQANVSLKRLNKFMNNDEIDPNAVSHDKNEKDPIVIENGTFAWDPETIVLKDITLRVPEGSLVAVVGVVGSGKSTLLSAVLGELDKIDGRVNTKGNIALVAQQAWIQNATLRDNILFGVPFEGTKYDRIVDSCALKPDLDILPAGDKTEIGEKGINLSGGQKQRVSLARAAYNNADVYLLDDPLSAVDSHVGKHIFDKVIGPKGILKNKTRILVTHGIAFLPQVDNIVVLKDGEISEMGTYRELLDRKGAFAEFLNQHITEEDISELEDPELIKDLQDVVGEIGVKKLRHMSDTSDGSITDSDLRKRRSSSKLSRQESVESSQRKLSKVSAGKAGDRLIEVEKSETESVKLAVYGDYFRAAGWHLSIGTFLFYFIYQAFSVGSNLWLSEWSNQPIVNGTQDPGQRDMYLGVYGAFGLLQGIAILAATVVMALGTLRSASNMHFKMLRSILHAPMSFFDTVPLGRIVNRFAKDIDVCDSTLPFNLRLWLNSVFSVAATLTIISYSTPIFVAVIIPVGVLYYLVQRFYVSTSRQLKRLESVTRSPIYSHFSETITGATTIRAYGHQERFILSSEAKVDHNQVSYFPSIVSNRWLAVRLETIGSTIIFFAALFSVLSRDTLSSGLVGLSISYSLQITMALNMLVRWTSDIETNIVAVERLKEYGEAPQEAPYEIESRKPPKTWPEKGEIKFDQYQTRYRPGLDLVLKNVTCSIAPGEKIGCVGRTGAGKSSLTLALFRIIEPANGTIVIDGQNITRLGLHDLRGRITIIPQDPVLFSGTLRINLDPFEQYTDETIWHSLELAHLKPFVKSLSAGLDHAISEGGENLSVGQRQLICLARALLRKTRVLVLDEATAAVDLETDDLIQQTIRTEFKDCTVITIAHRLNTIMDSTRVMVLDKGEIREFDTPQNLLDNKDSIFYGMAVDAGIS